MHSRRALSIGLALMAMTGTSTFLAACGGGPTSAEIARQVDANPGAQGGAEAFNVTQTRTVQEQADADAQAAELAKKRRDELADLEREQKAETDRIMNGDGAAGGTLDDSAIPIGSADPAVEKFRAQLSGVCQGGQKRLHNVALDAEKATKKKDPTALLKVAQDYTDTLNDFEAGLASLKPPASMAGDYREWLTTVDDLSSTIRLLLVSQGDKKKAARLQKKTETLATRLLEQSAGLGVTCLSVVE